jgi:hypothetical protein
MNPEQEIFETYEQNKIYLGMAMRTDYFNSELLKTVVDESTTYKLGGILSDIISNVANVEKAIVPPKS